MNLSLPRRARRMSLTPMIDVVFLLLVFFMLAARFGTEGVIRVGLGTDGASAYDGPPRLVDVAPDGLFLNGVTIDGEDLMEGLAPLMESPADTVVLRPREGANVQRVIDVMSDLSAAGLTGLVLVE